MVKPNPKLISHQEADHNSSRLKLTTNHQPNPKTPKQT